MIHVAKPSPPARTPELTPAEQELLRICRETGFGRLLKLQVKNGQPLLSQPFIKSRDYKFGSNSVVREPSKTVYQLGAKQSELIAEIRSLDSAVVTYLEIRGGLPISMNAEECLP